MLYYQKCLDPEVRVGTAFISFLIRSSSVELLITVPLHVCCQRYFFAIYEFYIFSLLLEAIVE